ncbi:hypothetical protein F5884DRAFT_745281 [Xylogone sp. PMI_703]|nr:hypothetical protein F5884DRAFT_745281 [Xylogone sp. PMI_703]
MSPPLSPNTKTPLRSLFMVNGILSLYQLLSRIADAGVRTEPPHKNTAKQACLQSEDPGLIYLYEQFNTTAGRRARGKAHVRYPDVEAFGPTTLSPAHQRAPTQLEIIKSLGEYNFEDGSFHVLQLLAKRLVLFCRHGEQKLVLGKLGDRKYELRIIPLSLSSLNDKYGLRGNAPSMSACFLSTIHTSLRGDSLDRRTILPLGVLLINGYQVPWIIVMNEEHSLWALHSTNIDSRDIVVQQNDIKTIRDPLGNNVSEAPFSWMKNGPKNSFTFSATATDHVYDLGKVLELEEVLMRPDLTLEINHTYFLKKWTTSPVWTCRITPSAQGIVSGLAKFNFTSPSKRSLWALVTAYLDFENCYGPDNNVLPLGTNNGRRYTIYAKRFEPEFLNPSAPVPEGGVYPGILHSLSFTHRGKEIATKTVFTLGLLLADDIPVPWVIFVDSNYVLWAVHPSYILASDDIRNLNKVDDEDDRYNTASDDFATSAALDSHGRNIAITPFGPSRRKVVFHLGKIDTIQKALVDASNVINVNTVNEYDGWTSKQI